MTTTPAAYRNCDRVLATRQQLILHLLAYAEIVRTGTADCCSSARRGVFNKCLMLCSSTAWVQQRAQRIILRVTPSRNAGVPSTLKECRPEHLIGSVKTHGLLRPARRCTCRQPASPPIILELPLESQTGVLYLRLDAAICVTCMRLWC
jgi:hypothetical protein